LIVIRYSEASPPEKLLDLFYEIGVKEEPPLGDFGNSISAKIVFRRTKVASHDDDRGSKCRFLDSFFYSLEIIATAVVRTRPIHFLQSI
jgi:hypothetical protein